MTGRTAWRTIGAPSGHRSLGVLAVIIVAGLAWIGWPVWGSLTVPSGAQAAAEAPWILGALLSGLVALTVAMWLDAGRRLEPLGVVGALVVLNTILRAVLSPAAAGVEFVHALPLVAGMAAGAPAGFLVGAASAILSTIAVGAPASTLPAQALVWGLSGMLGALLWRLRPRAAWLLSLPLALVAGVLSGVALNLMGWALEPGTTLTSFYPGLPSTDLLARLWGYTVATSLVLDLTRGATNLLILAVVGHPLLVALRQAVGADLGEEGPTAGIDTAGTDTAGTGTGAVSPAALARRDDRTRLDHLWTQGEQ